MSDRTFAGRVAARERTLDAGDSKRKLASEIEALEHRLNAGGGAQMWMGDEDDLAPVAGCGAMGDDEDMVEMGMDDLLPVGGGCMASEASPGIEDESNQDRFSEVEDLRHGEELVSGPSMRAIAPGGASYKARLAHAISRLDRVAEYLEKHGQTRMAYRIDRVSDAVEARMKGRK